MEKPQGIITIYIEGRLQKRNIKMLSCLIFQGFTGFYVTVFWYSFYTAYSDIELFTIYIYL